MAERVRKHIKKNKIFPLEQKWCRKGSYGCKDQLLVYRMIIENMKSRARNLNTAWIDYKKAFDSVPHSWIIKSLHLYKISPLFTNFLALAMKQW